MASSTRLPQPQSRTSGHGSPHAGGSGDGFRRSIPGSGRAGSYSSSGTSLPRSASTSTLPSIRSLRKAFLFTTNRRSSVDTGALGRQQKPPTTSTYVRTLSGSVPRPAAYPGFDLSPAQQNSSVFSASTSSLSDMRDLAENAATAQPGLSKARSASPVKRSSPLASTTVSPSPSKLLQHRASTATIYSSAIPVNNSGGGSSGSRPGSIISSRPPSVASRRIVKEQLSSSTSNIPEDSDEMSHSFLHIRSQKSTPPPDTPLPPVPVEPQTTSSNTTLPENPPQSGPFSPASLSHQVFATSTSATSLLDETLPSQADESLSTALDSPGHRPILPRSRSALESIKAIAAEVDANERQASVSSAGCALVDGRTRTDSLVSPRSRQSSGPKPIIMDSPSRSPALVDASRAFLFPPVRSLSAAKISRLDEGDSAERDVAGHPGRNSARERKDSATSTDASLDNQDLESRLVKLRNSSSSPLSELVARLSGQVGSSPTSEKIAMHLLGSHDPVGASLPTSTAVHNLLLATNASGDNASDLDDLRSQEGSSEAHYEGPGSEYSPFIAQGVLEDGPSPGADEDMSANGSSEISAPAFSPTRADQHTADDTIHPILHRSESANLVTPASIAQRRPSIRPTASAVTSSGTPRQISPQTEKRWSIAEIEAAYGRMRELAVRRTSEAHSETPSFVFSEDSKDLDPSFVRQLLEKTLPLDTSFSSSDFASGPLSGISPRNTSGLVPQSYRRSAPLQDLNAQGIDGTGDESETSDALTPLVPQERYSPIASPRLSHRSLSPNSYYSTRPNGSHRRSQSHSSARHSLDEARAGSPSSSGTASTSQAKSYASAALTAPTTVRHSLEYPAAKAHAGSGDSPRAPPVLRSLSDQSQQPSRKPLAAQLWNRRASATASTSAASSAGGSDDTGWMTPKTSAGTEHGHRRRSVSPALTAMQRSSSIGEHYDEKPHATIQRLAASATQRRRPVSRASSMEVEGPIPPQLRSATARTESNLQQSTSLTNLWYDDTPKAPTRSRPSIPLDFRGNLPNGNGTQQSVRRRESSIHSATGSSYSFDSFNTASFADAKRADKLDLFLRCTKAESALQAITTQAQIEKEAMLDAIQESRATISGLHEQVDELADQLDLARRTGSRKRSDESQETARRVQEIVQARDDWQARAQALERELAAETSRHAAERTESVSTIDALERQIATLQDQLAAARLPKAPAVKTDSSIMRSSLPRRTSPMASPKAPLSARPASSTALRTSLPNGVAKGSLSGLPRSRHSSGTGSIGSPRHGRAISNASSTIQTDFGDHLPAMSDGWSLGDSQDASLRLDDSTARFLQDIDGQSARSRQKSTTSSM